MKVALLDREGTIITDPDYDHVDNKDKIRLLPRTLEGLAYLATHGFGIVIVTNQTIIEQGRITKADFWDIHMEVLHQLRPSGIDVLGTYVCPHAAGSGCTCRKPAPGMLNKAADDFGLTPADTFMVGDRLSDVEAGVNAGMKPILVETGKRPVVSQGAAFTASDLLVAAEYIVAN